jgi:hypothetical protein
MGSLVEELKRRETAARAEAGRLRSRIKELSGDLARAEEQVSRLVIAREEVRRVLEAAEDAGRPLRAAEFAAATGLATDKAKVESLRSKLKLLAARGWLAGVPELPRRPVHPAGSRTGNTGARTVRGSSSPGRTCQPNRTSRKKNQWKRMPRSRPTTRSPSRKPCSPPSPTSSPAPPRPG